MTTVNSNDDDHDDVDDDDDNDDDYLVTSSETSIPQVWNVRTISNFASIDFKIDSAQNERDGHSPTEVISI